MYDRTECDGCNEFICGGEYDAFPLEQILVIQIGGEEWCRMKVTED